MATGSGKTFTAVNACYRLIKFGGAKRVLFLVDRSNLGRQTYREPTPTLLLLSGPGNPKRKFHPSKINERR